MTTMHRARFTACLAAALLATSACGSTSNPADGIAVGPDGAPAVEPSESITGSTDDVAPDELPADEEPAGTEPAMVLAGAVDADVTITASGFGGCVDAVQTASLELASTADDPTLDPVVWATFDLVLDHNCGDPGTSAVFERPDDTSNWRRDSPDGAVAVVGPVCDESITCTADTRTADFDGPVDRLVSFELLRTLDADELIADSPFDIALSALYDYDTDALDAQPIDIVLTVTVSAPSPVPSGDTTPIDTGQRPVEVVGAGYDIAVFPFAAFADTPEQLASVLDPAGAAAQPGEVDIEQRPIDIDALAIDWSTDAVIVLAIPTDLCPPVLAGLDVSNSVASAVFVNPGYRGCEQPLLSHTVIAAVDRTVLADVDELRLDPQAPYFDVAATATIDASPATAEPTSGALPAEFGSIAGTSPLPGPGEATVATLDNGSPVYVVRHRDGSVSALDPRTGEPLEAPAGLVGLVRWNAATRNFMARGAWDEYGRRLDGFRSSDMTGYATRVVEVDGAAIVEIGNQVGAPAGSPISITSDVPAMSDAAVNLDDPISVDEALALPVGATAVIDAVLVSDPSGSSICAVGVDDGASPFPLGSCPEGSPSADGVDSTPGQRSVFFGPLLATRTDQGFERIASTGGQAGEAL